MAKCGTVHRTEKVHPKDISSGGSRVVCFELRLAYSPDLIKVTRPVWGDVKAFWDVLRAQIRFGVLFSVRSPDCDLLKGFIERGILREGKKNRFIKRFVSDPDKVPASRNPSGHLS